MPVCGADKNRGRTQLPEPPPTVFHMACEWSSGGHLHGVFGRCTPSGSCLFTLGSSEPWVEPSSSDLVGFTGEGRFRVAFTTPEITRFFAARASPAVDRSSWAFAPL
jgi:hypothetical protein